MNDAKVFDAIVALLTETGKFRWIKWGRQESTAAGSSGAEVRILRLGFGHNPNQGNSDDLERRVHFKIDIRYFHTDPNIRKVKMIDLESLIYNTLNNRSIGGLTIPARTLVEAGVDNVKEDMQPGMSQTVMDCSFAYLVDPTGGLTYSSWQ